MFLLVSKFKNDRNDYWTFNVQGQVQKTNKTTKGFPTIPL